MVSVTCPGLTLFYGEKSGLKVWETGLGASIQFQEATLSEPCHITAFL